jgi:hypothetical protein
MLDNEKPSGNNQEYERGSVGIITAKTVKGNLKLIGLSIAGLVVIFCIAAFVEVSGIVYDMMIGAAAGSGISIIYAVCKIISITAKSKVKFIADLEEKKVQKNEQMEREAKVKAVEDARRKLHDLVVMQGKLKNYCESGIISEAEMKSTSEKLTVDIAEAEAELNALEERVEEKPQHVGEIRKVKVTPIRVSPGKSTDKKNATAESTKNKKNILTYSLAALCLALGILCVYQGIQIADLTGKALPWETNRTVLVTAYGYVDSRYHNGNCALSKKNVMRKMSEKEAISSGYKKCHACFG